MNIKEWLEQQRKLLDAATPGPWDAYDNYVMSEKANGERGKLVAECFASNPMVGDNSNDTKFIASVRTEHERALRLIDKYREALKAAEGFMFLACQPDRGNLFSEFDDKNRNALAYFPLDENLKLSLEDA